jgi:hypothetical protein
VQLLINNKQAQEERRQIPVIFSIEEVRLSSIIGDDLSIIRVIQEAQRGALYLESIAHQGCRYEG